MTSARSALPSRGGSPSGEPGVRQRRRMERRRRVREEALALAALVIALLEGRPDADALAFACAAGALTATRAGAQPSLPRREEVDRIIR